MAIKRVLIRNFKCFNGSFELSLNQGINILVGNNGSGKSSILEAIHLALTGMYCGKSIRSELSQYLFNQETVKQYIQSVNSGNPIPPPSILIEVVFDGTLNPEFEGNGNTDHLVGAEGFRFEIAYNEKFNDEYSKLVASRSMQSLPIEYYEVTWTSFARQQVTPRSIPIKSAMIDSSSYRYQNGSDVYISRIVKDLLSPEEITSVAQAHRKMRDSFIGDPSIAAINDRISNDTSIVGGRVSLSVDLSTKNAWESSLVTQLNDVPFGYIGKGDQCVLKTELALTQKQAQGAQIILLEEPESHLSFAKLNQLLYSIQQKYTDKQIIICTHSSFVANKLGLDNLLLLRNSQIVRITALPSALYFRKVSGYDTLRLILCKKAILVEGDSDELVVQKAYMVKNGGKLPIQDGIDVISVGTAFLRFLEIADAIHVPVSVVTDNDGDVAALENKYCNYLGSNAKPNIKICFDPTVDTGDLKIGSKQYNYNTLEPKMLKANGNNLQLFNEIMGVNYNDIDELRKYMKHNKTECALAMFETDRDIVFPEYILEAIS